MLPNWLYGKSKSKLASILGSGGSIPEDYNQVKAQVTQNAEDILLLSDALDDKAALTQISNSNILHNPWFTVNQRAISSVTTGGSYPADRWRTAGAGTLNITRDSNGCLVINNSESESDAYIVQRRTQTYVNSLRGNKLTGSIMLSDGTIHSGTITSPYNSNVYYEDDDLKLYTNFNTSSVECFVLQVKAGASVTVKALKLEVGEISTLHLDPRPEYAVELAKCQRYFQRIANTGNIPQFLTLGLAQGTSYIRGNVYFTQTRAIPSLSITGKCYAGLQGATDTLIEITKANAIIGNNLSYIVYSGTGLTDKQVYNIYLDSAAYIDIDAEL